MSKQSITVANYLRIRLEQLGIEHIFGVAGNYTAPFLDTILEEDTPIKIIGTSTEMNGGHAADAYARYNGYGAAFVTYSVGAFSLLNATAGSFVELAPVIVINGAPTNKEYSIEKNAGLLFSHSTGDEFVDIDVFKHVTVAAERITDANQAPTQIDTILLAMIRSKRPVYLEVTEDVWRADCGVLPIQPLALKNEPFISVPEVKQAVTAALQLIKERPKLLLWAGIELNRLGIENKFIKLLKVLNKGKSKKERIRFVTSFMSKSVIAETNPYFDSCQVIGKNMAGDDGCLLGLGGWTIDASVASRDIRGGGNILAAKGGVIVGGTFYPRVELGAFIDELTQALKKIRKQLSAVCPPPLPKPYPSKDKLPKPKDKLTFDMFFYALNSWIDESHILLSGVGLTLSIASFLKVPAQSGFLTQGAWLSIGYPVGAATGIKCAKPKKRAIVALGDGGFQEVCQAISDQNYHGHNTVVFVMSNRLYGIEQYLVNPNPFREKPTTYKGKDKILNKFYTYNDLHQWDYVKLAEAFGSKGFRVKTLAELRKVLKLIKKDDKNNFLVEVVVPKKDLPIDLAEFAGGVGEDEVPHEKWPPANKF